MDKEQVYFDNYAENWDRDRKADREKIERLLRWCRIEKGNRVLDAGCGTGILLPYLHDLVGAGGHIDGMDYSEQMVAKAVKKFGHYDNIDFIEKDILKYAFPDEIYDTVICFNLYPHVSRHREAFVKKIAKAVVPGGQLVIMHDISRRAVQAIQKQGPADSEELLPPLDVVGTRLVSAGFTVTAAVDEGDLYFIRAKKLHDIECGDTPLKAHGHAHTHPHTETKVVLNRLARISGHIEAVKRMIEGGRDCTEVLTQLAAVDSAVVSVSKVILKDHIDHCIVDSVRHNDMEAVENLKRAVNTFMK